jgi:hypothetical protein
VRVCVSVQERDREQEREREVERGIITDPSTNVVKPLSGSWLLLSLQSLLATQWAERKHQLMFLVKFKTLKNYNK